MRAGLLGGTTPGDGWQAGLPWSQPLRMPDPVGGSWETAARDFRSARGAGHRVRRGRAAPDTLWVGWVIPFEALQQGGHAGKVQAIEYLGSPPFIGDDPRPFEDRKMTGDSGPAQAGNAHQVADTTFAATKVFGHAQARGMPQRLEYRSALFQHHE